MRPEIHAAGVLGIALLAYALARVPRALFAEASGTQPSPKTEWVIAAVLVLVGVSAFELITWPEPAVRLIAAVALMVFAAILQGDIRFLVIPDLYTALVALGALFGPLALRLGEAALGAAVCGGLLALVAWLWKRRTAVEGLGFGDVKLAAAIGALLGAEKGLWAITASAAGGALLGLILQARAQPQGTAFLFPYGAPLALAGAALLIWRLR